jgi:HK97 family phage prohead protease
MLKYISTSLKAMTGGWSAIISTPQVDTDAESVDPMGLINRDEYMSNPLVYWAHEWAFNPSAEPIGKAKTLDVFRERITSDGMYAPTPKAQNVRALVDGGFVSRTSVGFDPIEMKMVAGIPTHTRWALREYSIVPMPANPGAVITGVKSALAWLADNFDPETLAEHRLALASPSPGTVTVYDGDRIIGKAVLILSPGEAVTVAAESMEPDEDDTGAVPGEDGAEPYDMDDQQAAAPIQLARRRIAVMRSHQ